MKGLKNLQSATQQFWVHCDNEGANPDNNEDFHEAWIVMLGILLALQQSSAI